MLLGEFLELQARRAGDACSGVAGGVASRPSNAALLPRAVGRLVIIINEQPGDFGPAVSI